MRTISKYISFALMAFAVVACHTNEIDNPDNSNPPQISDNVTFTASIKQTRVEYTPNGDKLDQCWKKNDVIYGFYGDEDGSKIILQVTDVDSYGYAKLEPLYDTGPAFVAALKESVKNGEDLTIGLIYTGKTDITDSSYDNEISVSLLDQSTGQIPACMSCYQYDDSKTDEDGNTIVDFIFDNDCAILEIKGITGAKEGANLSEGSTIGLKSVTVSSVYTSLTYTYAGGKLSDPVASTSTGSIIVSPVTGSLFVDSNGNVVDSNGNSASVMMAVAPNDEIVDIAVTAETSDGVTFGSLDLYKTAFDDGVCYVIRPKDVVAKTVDGLYFTTVKAAFDHAATLNVSNNTVTLVKENITGLGEHPSPTQADYEYDVDRSYLVSSLEIKIDYSVTLDLNGCALSLSGDKIWNYGDEEDEDDDDFISDATEYFSVTSGATFTITDSKKSGGNITSVSAAHIISNEGTVEIDGGTLKHNKDWSVVDNDGKLYVNDGVLFSDDWHTIQNAGEAHIEGGTIYSRSSFAISDYGTSLIINGGELYSVDNHAIKSNEGASVTIVEEGKEDECYPLIYNVSNNTASIVVSDITATGTQFNMRNGLVYSPYGAIELNCNVNGEISGGQLESNAYCSLAIGDGSDITISGGKFISTASGHPSIRVYSKDKSNQTSIEIVSSTNQNSREPLLYSISPNNACLVADGYGLVSGDNYSTVSIAGGYLYSNYDEFYYEINKPDLHLKISDFGEFYSNKERIYYEGRTHYLYSTMPRYPQESINSKVAVPLNDDSISVSLTLHQVNSADNSLETMSSSLDISFNYHITRGGDLQKSGTQSYQFGGFSW